MLRPTHVLAATPAARTSVSPTHPSPATRQIAKFEPINKHDAEVCPDPSSLYLGIAQPTVDQDDTNPNLSFIRHPNARFIIYTDGSTTAGTLNDGVGMVVTEEDPANPTTILTKQQRGAANTSSYDEEKAAMCMALEWLSPSDAVAAICTVSQSLLKAIRSGSADTADLRSMLNKRAGKIILLWIPGHHGIAGNEDADD